MRLKISKKKNQRRLKNQEIERIYLDECDLDCFSQKPGNLKPRVKKRPKYIEADNAAPAEPRSNESNGPHLSQFYQTELISAVSDNINKSQII